MAEHSIYCGATCSCGHRDFAHPWGSGACSFNCGCAGFALKNHLDITPSDQHRRLGESMEDILSTVFEQERWARTEARIDLLLRRAS